jgi:hypothetical protein
VDEEYAKGEAVAQSTSYAFTRVDSPAGLLDLLVVDCMNYPNTERVLVIGDQFSNLYTAVDTPPKTVVRHARGPMDGRSASVKGKGVGWKRDELNHEITKLILVLSFLNGCT